MEPGTIFRTKLMPLERFRICGVFFHILLNAFFKEILLPNFAHLLTVSVVPVTTSMVTKIKR